MTLPKLIPQIQHFIQQTASAGSRESFTELDRLALSAFSFQYERIEPFQRLCDRRGRTPSTVTHWSEIPPVPTSAFKSLRLCAGEARECFRSSGTTRGARTRSVHYHPYPELYRATIDASFRDSCLPGGRPLPTLSLIPSREQVPDSSLSFMADHILAHHTVAPRCVAIDERGIEVDRALGWLQERTARSEPGLILATAFALVELLDELEERDARVRLPEHSVVFETGGFKGRQRELSRAELLRSIEVGLGVTPDFVVREYGMTELTGQAYTRVLRGGDPDCFFLPPWMRFQLLDPGQLAPVEPGEPGLLALFDLSNVGSALTVLTEDVARQQVGRREDAGGFRLEGRASGAELRGCSLTVEELVGHRGDTPA